MLKGLGKYIKDNPEGYWFKSRLYGWGWIPATREGWLVTLAFIGFILWNGFSIDKNQEPTPTELGWFFARIGIAIVVLIVICFKTGERPHWQWGVPNKYKRDLDDRP